MLDYLRHYLLNGLLVLLLMFVACFGHGQSLKFMTYNIRYDNPQDGPDNWHHRKDDLVKFIADTGPAIFGIQEGLLHQVAHIDEGMKQYRYFGVGRDDGKSGGEYCAVFYQPDQVKLIESSTFWLSETPEEISIGWDAALPRICTYGLFEEQDSGQKFWVFNTHFDHRGVSAREQSASLIVEQIKSINKQQLPVILMGDFNATVGQKPIQTLKTFLNDSRDITSQAPKGPHGTTNGFKSMEDSRTIDFIFSSGFTVNSIEHVDARTSKGRYLSDHLPVIVDLVPEE